MSPLERSPLIDDPDAFIDELYENGPVGKRVCVEGAGEEGLYIYIEKTEAGLVVQLHARPWATTRDVRAAESVFLAWNRRVGHRYTARPFLMFVRESMRELIRSDIERYTKAGRTRWKDLADHYNILLAELATFEPSSHEEAQWYFEGQGTFMDLLKAVGTAPKVAIDWWDSAQKNKDAKDSPFPPGEPIGWRDIQKNFRPDR